MYIVQDYFSCSEGEGAKHIRNAGSHLPNCTRPRTWRQYSSDFNGLWHGQLHEHMQGDLISTRK